MRMMEATAMNCGHITSNSSTGWLISKAELRTYKMVILVGDTIYFDAYNASKVNCGRMIPQTTELGYISTAVGLQSDHAWNFSRRYNLL